MFFEQCNRWLLWLIIITAIQYNTIQCNAIQCNTAPHRTAVYNTKQHNTIQYNILNNEKVIYISSMKHNQTFYSCSLDILNIYVVNVCLNTTKEGTLIMLRIRALDNVGTAFSNDMSPAYFNDATSSRC